MKHRPRRQLALDAIAKAKTYKDGWIVKRIDEDGKSGRGGKIPPEWIMDLVNRVNLVRDTRKGGRSSDQMRPAIREVLTVGVTYGSDWKRALELILLAYYNTLWVFKARILRERKLTPTERRQARAEANRPILVLVG